MIHKYNLSKYRSIFASISEIITASPLQLSVNIYVYIYTSSLQNLRLNLVTNSLDQYEQSWPLNTFFVFKY